MCFNVLTFSTILQSLQSKIALYLSIYYFNFQRSNAIFNGPHYNAMGADRTWINTAAIFAIESTNRTGISNISKKDVFLGTILQIILYKNNERGFSVNKI